MIDFYSNQVEKPGSILTCTSSSSRVQCDSGEIIIDQKIYKKNFSNFNKGLDSSEIIWNWKDFDTV